MSQANVIVNLDKREMLNPQEFDDGVKLTEFGCSGGGIMLALTLLSSTGNCNSGGDIYRSAYRSEPDRFEVQPGEKISLECEVTRDHEHNLVLDGMTYRTIVPESSGRWVGDRIITAGACGADTDQSWSTNADMFETTYAKTYQRYQDTRCDGAASGDVQLFSEWLEANKLYTIDVNIYDVACHRFTDISDEVHEQLKMFGLGRRNEFWAKFEFFLLNKLRHDFGTHVLTRPKGKRLSFDFRWMDWESFDSFILSYSSKWSDLKECKAWLRKQDLTGWQRDILKHYHGYFNPRCHPRDENNICRVLDHHGIFKKPRALRRGGDGNPDNYEFPPMIPNHNYTAEAVRHQLIDHDKSRLIPFITDHQKGIQPTKSEPTTRQRVINLGGTE